MASLTPNGTVKIHFSVKKRVQFGQAAYVIGSLPQIGSWNVSHALRLIWNDGHIWTGSIEIEEKKRSELQFKYVVGLWENPSLGKIEWQAGRQNRKITLEEDTKCENTWNMENICLNLFVSKQKFPLNQYYVTGNCKELGQWRQSKPLKQIKISHYSYHSQDFCSKFQRELKNYNIFSYQFKVYRGAKEVHYFYLKKSDQVKAQRVPGRKLNLQENYSSHPRCFHIESCHGKVQVYEKCVFNEIIYSQVNNDIFLGPYIRTIQDIENLQRDNVGAIFSIQSEQDYTNHYLSAHYLSLLCKEYKIDFSTHSILDANPDDFKDKWYATVKIFEKVVKKCREEGKKVYIHCTAGIYRSSQILALYLVIYLQYTLQQAIKVITKRHLVANPNSKLLTKILKEYKLKKKKN